MIKKTIVGKTIRELRSRCQSLERSQEKIKPEPASMKEYFEHQNSMKMNMKLEKLESIEVNQEIEKELRQTREKLAQCQNSLKIKERKIEDQEKEINQLQSKRKKITFWQCVGENVTWDEHPSRHNTRLFRLIGSITSL